MRIALISIFIAVTLLLIVGVIYIVRHFHRFGFIQKIAEKHKLISWIVSFIPIAIVSCFFVINIYSPIIVLIHLFFIWLICDIISWVIKKTTKKDFKRYYSGAVAIAFTIIYLSHGWFCAHHVYQTNYTFETTKDIGSPIRIVEIADSHLGITLDGDEFADEMKKVQETSPDAVVIAGDFVDDDTYKADMVKACKALGALQTKYGVYFIFGNHDKGYYTNYRDFTSEELRAELRKNNIAVLEDDGVLVDNRFYILGRQDRTVPDRADMQTLTEELDKSKYMILLDHQPNDYDNEAASNVDLVLSGHTHGGHLFPLGIIGDIFNINDRTYGTEVRNGTTFVVSSGISGWAIPFKTGTISEFVVIDIK